MQKSINSPAHWSLKQELTHIKLNRIHKFSTQIKYFFHFLSLNFKNKKNNDKKYFSGRYQCLAENIAATRETPVIKLGVHGE